jgi:fructokinase
MTDAELDVLTLGMMMGEVAPPRAGAGFGDGRGLVLFPSGSMTIFALALARLGARVGLLSRVGDDDLGRWMRARVEEAGIDAEGVATVAGQLTPLALASVDATGNKSFSYYRFTGVSDPLATLGAAEVPDAALRRARIFDFGEASLRSPLMRAETLKLAQRARDLGLAICYTPNYRAAAWSGGAAEAADAQRSALALADVTLMNAEESALLSGSFDSNAAARRMIALGP